MNTATALLIVFWGAMASALAAQTQPEGRVPNTSEKQHFPRWLPKVMLDGRDSGPNVFSRIRQPSCAVDDRNILHVVAVNNDPIPGDDGLVYYTSEFGGTRRANGFSTNVLLATGYAGDPDIAVGPSNSVKIVYDDTDGSLWQKKKTGTGWDTTAVATGVPLSAYKVPQVVIDSSNTAHIVARRVGSVANQAIVYFSVTETNIVSGPHVIATYVESAANPRISLGSDGIHVLWEADTTGVWGTLYRFSVNGTTWTGRTVISTGSRGDLWVDPSESNAIHLTWMGSDRKVRYEKDTDGVATTTNGTSEIVSSGQVQAGMGGPEGLIRLVVDAHHQPHLVWVTTESKMAYAVRMTTRTDLTYTAGVWPSRQEPVGPGIFMPLAAGVSKNGTVHVMGGNEVGYDAYYTRMIEFNLGAQDPKAHVGVGAAASANLTNGNLLLNFPLFASRGSGLSAAMTVTYNSLEDQPGVISPGWIHNYHMYLVDSQVARKTTGDRITLFRPDGSSAVLEWKDLGPTDQYHVADDEFGFFGRIERQADSITCEYLLTAKDGTKFRFRDDGKLREVEDTNGNKLTLTYTSGRLTNVEDSTGRDTTIIYDASNRMDEIEDHGGVRYKLRYDAAGKLSSVTLNESGGASEKLEWEFQYHATDNAGTFNRLGLISQVTSPGSNDFRYFYYVDNRFASSRDPILTQPSIGAGAQHPDQVVTYTDPVDPAIFPEVGGYVTALEPAAEFENRRGHSYAVVFEQRKALVRKATDALTHSSFFNYSIDFRNLVKAKDRLGNETVYTYRHESGGTETPAYVKDLLAKVFMPPPNSDPGAAPDMANPVASFTYSNNIFRTLTSTDAKGNVTKYHYDQLSSSPSDPATGVSVGNVTEVAYPATAGVVAVEKYAYDSQGRITSHTSPQNVGSGASTTFVYGDATTGLVTQIYRPDHQLPEQLGYDVMGNVTSHTLPKGGQTQMTLDGLYRVTLKIDPAGDEASSAIYAYDAEGRLDTVTGPGTSFSDNEYDEIGRLIESKVTAAPGRVLKTSYHYDAEGNVREIHDPRGKITASTYDALNRLDIETRPGNPGPNVVTNLDYDDNGNVTSRTVGTKSTTYAYDARNNLKAAQHSDGSRDEQTYDERDAVVLSLHKASLGGATKHGSRSVYDERGRLKASTQLIDFTNQIGFTTEYAHDKNSNVVKVTDPLLKTRAYQFDQSDRHVRSLDHNLQIVSEVAYNDNDLPEIVKTPHPETGFLQISQKSTYNLRNELKTSTDVFGNVTTYVYNALGQQVMRQTPSASGSSCLTRIDYDLLGRVLREAHDPGSASQVVWSHDYDENGNRIRTVDPKGNVYKFKFDDAGRMLEMEYPSVGGGSFVESWGYDDRGNLISHIDAEGKVATLTYDLMDRLEQETHVKAGVTLAAVTRSYDISSNLTGVLETVSKVKISFTDDLDNPAYDALNRLTQVRWFLEYGTPSQVMWKKIQYAYDAAGNLFTMTDPEGHLFEYGYDVENRLSEIRRTRKGGTETLIATFSYYAVSGLRRDVTFIPNAPSGYIRQTYHYDEKARLISLECARSTGAILSRFDYEYDPRDRRTKSKLEHLNCHVSYTYDCRDQLTGETWSGNASPPPGSCVNDIQSPTPGNVSVDSNTATVIPGSPTSVPTYTWSCTYDLAGNRETRTVGSTSTTYVVDSQNRLASETTSGVTTNYGYDKNGNQISRTVGSTEEQFGYDYANRLKTYLKKVSGATTVSYLYRATPTGERLAKVNLLSGVNNEEWFMYDGQDTTADYVRSSSSVTYQVKRTYVNGRSIDSKIARIESLSTEATYFYLGDALGSVHEMVDSAGTVTRRVLNTAWGEDLPGFTPLLTTQDRHGFTQREHDSESEDANGNGLAYFRARSYDSRLGRFIQKDPVQQNRIKLPYSYASNDPISRVDPDGTNDFKEWQRSQRAQALKEKVKTQLALRMPLEALAIERNDPHTLTWELVIKLALLSKEEKIKWVGPDPKPSAAQLRGVMGAVVVMEDALASKGVKGPIIGPLGKPTFTLVPFFMFEYSWGRKAGDVAVMANTSELWEVGTIAHRKGGQVVATTWRSQFQSLVFEVKSTENFQEDEFKKGIQQLRSTASPLNPTTGKVLAVDTDAFRKGPMVSQDFFVKEAESAGVKVYLRQGLLQSAVDKSKRVLEVINQIADDK